MSQEQTIEKLLESLDNEIFTEDMKIQMKQILDSKINSLVESKSKQYDQKIEKISKDYEEKQEKELNEFKEETLNTLNEYLTKTVNEFVEQNEETILEQTIVNEAVEIHKIFDSIMEQYNFNFAQAPQKAQIVSNDKETKKELEKTIEESVKIKKQLQVLKEEKEGIQKQLIISNYASKIDSAVERHKFTSLAENFIFIPNEKSIFEKKLVELVESIVETEQPIENYKKEKQILETTSLIKEEQEIGNGKLTVKQLRQQISKY